MAAEGLTLNTLRNTLCGSTNAIESLNSVIRKAIKKRKIFSHDQSALKVIYLAIESASAKWTMSIYYWRQALNDFMIK